MGEDANSEEPKEPRFASAEKMDRYEYLLSDFLVHILDFDLEDVDHVFVSDGSSLWDFNTAFQGPKANRGQVAS